MSLHFYKNRIKRALIFLCLLFFWMFVFHGFNETTLPYLKSIATYHVRSYVNTLLREGVDEGFEGIHSSDGSYDVVAIRKQLSVLVEETSKILENESGNQILYELPMGTLTQNVWFMNIGPKIPIRMRLLQAVQGEIKSELIEYGLNNALLKIHVILSVEVEVLAPYHLEELVIQSEIPLVIDVIEGEVPSLMTQW